jgi:ElaB/YqjD/DUF883 family membrane-anchored ribosome-binding protein
MNRSAAEVELEVEAQRGHLDQTVEALKDKLTPGEVFDEASRAMGDAGQQVLAKLLDQARQNPMPVALVGVGLAWLMSGSGQSASSGGSPAGGPGQGLARASSTLSSAGDRIAGGAQELGRGASEGIKHLGDRAHAVGDTLSDRAHRLGDKAQDLVSDMKETVSTMSDTMTSGAASLGHSGEAAAQRLSATARDTSRRVGESGATAARWASDLVKSEPLLIGALGLAVGFAIGAALPRTPLEDETLGHARDQWLQKGRELARDTLDHAGEVAQAAYAAAESEIQSAVHTLVEPSAADEPGRPETV